MNIKEFVRYQEMTFDSYCKRLVKNEYQNAIRDIMRHEKHEVVFSILKDMDVMNFSYEDRYDLENTVFYIEQQAINVNNFYLSGWNE